ncbi:MAG TPA: transcriptional repressor [Acidobacteriaceae bacterium]|jgi:Fur family ferric uptake transcriptional regulator|nr:transcriptional repressor [Acidobacteriaceae bacterium]
MGKAVTVRDKRQTRQKAAIRQAFVEADRPLSPEEALEGAQQRHSTLGIATVYRNLQALVKEGWLQAVEVPGDSTHYEVAGKEHHHHFQCNVCGKLYDLEGCIAAVRAQTAAGISGLWTRILCLWNLRSVCSSADVTK